MNVTMNIIVLSNYLLVIDGGTVVRQEIQVIFEEPYESKQIDIEAGIGKRLVRIITTPDESRIRNGDRWLVYVKTPKLDQ